MAKSNAVAVVDADLPDIEGIEPDMFKSLDEKQKAFCKEYVQDWNIGRAAVAVFGGKEATARARGYELLERKRIRLYCKYLNENAEITTGVSRSWVIEQHLKLVRSSIAHLHNTWIDRKDFDTLTEDQKYCIEEISTQTRTEQAETEDGETEVQVDYVKIKLYNKQKSLDAISRLMGYEKAQKLDVNLKGGLATIINVQVNVYNTAPPLASSEKEIV